GTACDAERRTIVEIGVPAQNLSTIVTGFAAGSRQIADKRSVVWSAHTQAKRRSFIETLQAL
ncbi:hypothetical protein, partial [Pseudomonas syringae]